MGSHRVADATYDGIRQHAAVDGFQTCVRFINNHQRVVAADNRRAVLDVDTMHSISWYAEIGGELLNALGDGGRAFFRGESYGAAHPE